MTLIFRSPPDPGQAAAAAETELCPGEASPGGGHLLSSLLHHVPLPAGLLRVRDHHGRVRGAEHAQLPGQHHPCVADCPGRHHLHPVHHPLLWRHKHLLSGRIRNILNVCPISQCSGSHVNVGFNIFLPRHLVVNWDCLVPW